MRARLQQQPFPLRPDGGIDWDRAMPDAKPEVLRLMKQVAAYERERCATALGLAFVAVMIRRMEP